MSEFDANTVPLQGLNIIEASAGTGKTHTLTTLYLRLLLEQQLPVEHILVVTYTRAATEELTSKLRQKLVTARELMLADAAPDQSKQLQRLNLAIQSFDQAAIYTIHGFCQRLLSDFAFESGSRFDMEMIGDDRQLIESISDDFWRRHVTEAAPPLTRYLLNQRQSPATLLTSVRGLIGKPYLQITPIVELNIKQIESRIQQQFKRLRTLWSQQQDQISAILHDKTLLNGNKYRKTSVEKWLILLADMLDKSTPPDTLFEDFDRFTQGKLESALKKGQTLPTSFFWPACETYLELDKQWQDARQQQLQSLRQQLLSFIQQQLPKRKQLLQQQSYDDLLLSLQQALQGPVAERLITAIRAQYRAALIDEFQDTDPVQYDCFHTLYGQSGLPTFFVGDPKQAIYSFRGADIFTYLQAKSSADHQYTLTTNWRSHERLVAAVNHLFCRRPNPFIYQQIPFNPVNAERRGSPAFTIDGQPQTAMQILWTQSQAAEKPLDKGVMNTIAAKASADDIARLLNLAQQGSAQIAENNGWRPLKGGDIAVLVHSHRQALLIQLSLQQRGISSVQQGRGNVFISPQAEMLERVLQAVVEPANDRRISAALSTPIFAKTASELDTLQQDESRWLSQLDFFHDLHEQWQKQGFMSMFRLLLASSGAPQRLLALTDGERQMTNLLHIAELIQAYSTSQNSAMEAVLHWLGQHRLAIAEEDETAQLRLESDEQLVKIQTIHSSKGLEYPLVYCPFLWSAQQRSSKAAVLSYHQPDTHQACAAFAEPALTEARPLVANEQQAEDLRLLYVALTRARERCVIIWGAVKDVQKTALFSLLHSRTEKPEPQQMLADLSALAADPKSFTQYQQIELDQPVVVTDKQRATTVLAAREFNGELQPPWRIGSFTGLSSTKNQQRPDHDALLFDSDKVMVRERHHDRFGFPRGAVAGSCLHSIFEQWDFNATDRPALLQLVERMLIQYGFSCDWTTVVADWVEQVLQTPLNPDNTLKLADLSPPQCLDEMAFYFPVAQLSVRSLTKALAPCLSDNPLLNKLLGQLQFHDLTGFIKGFIDLVFEYQGQFYIVDYKSNWLGNDAGAYQQQALDEAMLAHRYPLQYWLYSLALHRYLRLRLPDYDPAVHFGGVYYLFIRGMHPDWQQAGIYHDRPDGALLDALDQCLREVEHG